MMLESLDQADGEHPISHSGPKNLSRTGGPEHYLIYAAQSDPLRVGKTVVDPWFSSFPLSSFLLVTAPCPLFLSS